MELVDGDFKLTTSIMLKELKETMGKQLKEIREIIMGEKVKIWIKTYELYKRTK